MTEVRLSYVGGGVVGTLPRIGEWAGVTLAKAAEPPDSCWSLLLRERACWLALRATAAEGKGGDPMSDMIHTLEKSH